MQAKIIDIMPHNADDQHTITNLMEREELHILMPSFPVQIASVVDVLGLNSRSIVTSVSGIVGGSTILFR